MDSLLKDEKRVLSECNSSCSAGIHKGKESLAMKSNTANTYRTLAPQGSLRGGFFIETLLIDKRVKVISVASNPSGVMPQLLSLTTEVNYRVFSSVQCQLYSRTVQKHESVFSGFLMEESHHQ